MVILVDDLLDMVTKVVLEVPINSVIQTAWKTSWAEYYNDLKKLLLRSKNDLEKEKITQVQYKEIEAYIFKEMRVARSVMDSNEQ